VGFVVKERHGSEGKEKSGSLVKWAAALRKESNWVKTETERIALVGLLT
jgi:hypothetical protein